MTALNFPDSPVQADTYTDSYIYDGEKWIIIRSRVVNPLVTYVTWDSATATSVTLSGGNLIASNTGTTSADQGARVAATALKTSGKWYFEIEFTTIGGGGNLGVGVGATTSTYTTMGGSATIGDMLFKSGNIYANGINAGGYFSARTSGQDMGIAVDLDNHKIWYRNVPSGNWNGNASYSPVTNVGGIAIPVAAVVPLVTFGGTSGAANNVLTANFGATAFLDTVPSGFTSGWIAGSQKNLNGSAKAAYAFTNTGTVTLTTTLTNNVIVLVVLATTLSPNPARTVASVTSSGLTWTKRSGNNYTATGAGSMGTDRHGVEIWWAVAAAALTSHVITVTWSGTFDNCYLHAFGVNGCATPSAPWDTHASLATAFVGMTNGSPIILSGVSTTSTTPFMVVGSAAPSLSYYIIDDCPQIQLSQDSAAAHYASLQTAYSLRWVAQASATFSGNSGSPSVGVLVVDALA